MPKSQRVAQRSLPRIISRRIYRRHKNSQANAVAWFFIKPLLVMILATGQGGPEGAGIALVREGGVNTKIPLSPAVRHITRAVLLAGVSCLMGCAFRPQLYDRSTTGIAATTGQPIRKFEAAVRLCGGRLDPESVGNVEEKLEMMFGSHDPDSLTIAFFTDVGLVDRTVSLGEFLERFVDKNPIRRVENIRRGWIQDHGDAAYLACVLRVFRMAAERGYISAVVHGGDAVQIGVAPEFETYLEIVGRFLVSGQANGWESTWRGTWWETPLVGCRQPVTFYQVNGNHEVLFLGSFNGGGFIRVPADGVRDSASFARLLPRLSPWRGLAETTQISRTQGEGTCRRGYYQAYQPLPNGQQLLMVMLNTSQGTACELASASPKDASIRPVIGVDQLDWLEATLVAGEADPSVAAVIVFGHHPLAEVTVYRAGATVGRKSSIGELPAHLTEFSKVKAYVCGHIHSGCTPVVHPGRYPLTEYVVPSLMEFPKCFALIRLERKIRTGDYHVSVRHHALAELVDFEALPNVTFRTSPLRPEQTRFNEFVAALDRATTNHGERLLTLAKLAYLDAAKDVANHGSRVFPNCFASDVAPELRWTYAGSQSTWEALKRAGGGESAREICQSWRRIAATLQTPIDPDSSKRPPKMASKPAN